MAFYPDLRGLIQSERERIRLEIDRWEWNDQHAVPAIGRYVERKYIGGPPPKRIREMQNNHEGRARRAGVPWDVIDLRRVYKRDNGYCGICKLPVSLEEFTIDHIVPLSRGGPHLLDNLQIAHRACNTSKGDS